MRVFDLVIFDLDGVLVDNRFAIRENFNHALRTFGYEPLPDSKIFSLVGNHLDEMFRCVIPEGDAHLAPKLAAEYRQRYSETSADGVVILDGALDMLKEMRSDGFLLAVATAKMEPQARDFMNRIGLDEYFDFIAGYTENSRPKPHPDTLLRVMSELRAVPQRTALVGDTPVDVAAARSAGVCPIVVTTGIGLGFTTMEEISRAEPGIVIDSLRELKKHL